MTPTVRKTHATWIYSREALVEVMKGKKLGKRGKEGKFHKSINWQITNCWRLLDLFRSLLASCRRQLAPVRPVITSWRLLAIFRSQLAPIELLRRQLAPFRPQGASQRDNLGWLAGRIRTQVGRVSLSNFMLPCPDALTDLQN